MSKERESKMSARTFRSRKCNSHLLDARVILTFMLLLAFTLFTFVLLSLRVLQCPFSISICTLSNFTLFRLFSLSLVNRTSLLSFVFTSNCPSLFLLLHCYKIHPLHEALPWKAISISFCMSVSACSPSCLFPFISVHMLSHGHSSLIIYTPCSIKWIHLPLSAVGPNLHQIRPWRIEGREKEKEDIFFHLILSKA